VGTEGVALNGIKGSLKQGAEDGGFDVLPIRCGGLEENGDLSGIERENAGLLKEASVEAKELLIEDDGILRAGLHLGEELAELGNESLGLGAEGFQEAPEAIFRQESDILGKHAEEAAGQKLADELWRMATLLKG
jgi:hypothetical protein